VFDLIEFKITVQVLKQYHKLHDKLPGRLQASDFLEKQITATRDLPDRTAKDLREVFEDIYVPLSKEDMDYLNDQFILSVQQKEIDSTVMRYSQGELTEKDLFTRMNTLSSMAMDKDSDEYKESGFLVADRDKHLDERIEGHPTFLHDLNMLTAAGGFYSPQLVIIMSGPKHFKTGIIIKTAVEYARNGYKVYYADGENGARSIRNRAKMAIMECELKDLFDESLKNELDLVLESFGKNMGGDLFIDSFAAGTKCVNDIEGRLDYLKREYGFIPDIIVWDSIDHFIPNSDVDRRRDTRIQSQKVYHEVIGLNKRLGCFSIAPSQVNRAAVSKKVFTMKDIAEDFGKIMNAHAVFAICATDEELEAGRRRIIPIAQREGQKFTGHNMCMVQIDESKMIVDEIDQEQINMDMDDD
jgi:KaiC/GvpD/RAD55 family RecA-like ATPase